MELGRGGLVTEVGDGVDLSIYNDLNYLAMSYVEAVIGIATT